MIVLCEVHLEGFASPHTGVALTYADSPDAREPRVMLLGDLLSPERHEVVVLPAATAPHVAEELLRVGYAVRYRASSSPEED